MYSPHQIPWTIEGTKDLLAQVYELSSVPFYTTIDTGHQSGQRRFQKPEKEVLLKSMEHYQKNRKITFPGWVLLMPINYLKVLPSWKNGNIPGLQTRFSKFLKATRICLPNHYCSPYKWLEELGCYSPIIHLQQTDGTFSRHLPFTMSNNEKGVIDGRRVLESLKISYDDEHGLDIPKVDNIYMTIEVFLSTASVNYLSLLELEETVKYWRQYIPEDGMNLKEIVSKLN